MLEIIKQSGIETITERSIDFYNEDGDICLGFPVDDNGDVIITPVNKENYEFGMMKCAEGLWTKRINKNIRHFRTNTVARCYCGAEIELYNEYLGACECPVCGRWYNIFGQEVKNPEEWGDGEDW